MGRGVRAATGYVGEHGAIPHQTAKVPDDGGTFSLGAWVSVQRQLHRRGLLAEERGAALEAVDRWRWDPRPRRPDRE